MSKVVSHERGLAGGFRSPRREWSDREGRGGGFWVDRAMTEALQAGQGAERRQPQRWESMSKDLEVRGCLASLPSAWASSTMGKRHGTPIDEPLPCASHSRAGELGWRGHGLWKQAWLGNATPPLTSSHVGKHGVRSLCFPTRIVVMMIVLSPTVLQGLKQELLRQSSAHCPHTHTQAVLPGPEHPRCRRILALTEPLPAIRTPSTWAEAQESVFSTNPPPVIRLLLWSCICVVFFDPLDSSAKCGRITHLTSKESSERHISCSRSHSQ